MKAFQLRVELAPQTGRNPPADRWLLFSRRRYIWTVETRTKATNHGQIELYQQVNIKWC